MMIMYDDCCLQKTILGAVDHNKKISTTEMHKLRIVLREHQRGRNKQDELDGLIIDRGVAF